MRILVTGGAGFIGSHLVDRLVDIAEVTVYDNLTSGRKEFVEHHLNRSGFQFIEADLLELDKLKEAIKGCHVVFHLATKPDTRAGIKDTSLNLKQGTIATYNVLEAMRVNELKKIVFSSSSTVYGEIPVKPIPEDYGPLQPISLYGASKLACEGLITAFCHLFSMQAWIFRFCNVVGPRATHGVIFDLINKLKRNPQELEILGNGNQEKPCIHVSDCVEGILYGFRHSDSQVSVFNLGSSSSIKVSAIAQMIVEEMGLSGVKFKYTGGERGWPGDVPQMRFDTSKMERLGWKPKYSSPEAARKAIRDILSSEK